MSQALRSVPSRAPLNQFFGGKTVKGVYRSSTFVLIRFMDGTSYTVGWQGDDGKLVKGRPVIVNEGTHVLAKPAQVPGIYRARESGVLVPSKG